MKSRLITAAIALPVIIFSIVFPAYAPNLPEADWLFVAIAAFALAAGLFEYFSIAKKLELKADAGVGYLAAALLFVLFVFDAPSTAPDLLLASAAFCVILIIVTQAFRFQKDFSKMLAGIGAVLLGVFYIAFLGGFIVAMRTGFEDVPGLSTKLLGFFFLVGMGSDVGAYFIGRSVGKYKMAPQISPNKTWEGFAGGLMLGAGFAALSTFWFFPELPYQISIPLGIVMALVGVAGDLSESAMKRAAKSKDTASILPGHGGFLDRLDSLLFNAPLLYYFARSYFG
ncbi:MAG: hypothetical protein DWQ47_12650 [Acidobacteria bacterium]|nr:MAG: hypothetical protein DWQ32_00050 [Acidobacteriota bacterium]REK03065.1 MAG: hypothetical protein DWQ38_12085 [Acidobacteriota bacterium]REK13131.1 MAG: hypothetical protein DWQ43_05740 [Acidobacteriota bacterium]REK41125.1 MAG: hypothetical protein DWQ47_12650 [Acidobacteriota bacterium]